MANYGLAVVILGADQKRTLRKIKGKVFEVSSFKFQRNIVLINVIFHVAFYWLVSRCRSLQQTLCVMIMLNFLHSQKIIFSDRFTMLARTAENHA